MKSKGLLVAAGVLAVLGGALWYSNREEAKKASSPAADAAAKILSIAEPQLKEIRIARTVGENTVIARNPAGVWEITAPKPYPADVDAASQLATALGQLTSDKVIEEKAGDLSGYGLATPAMTITLLRKDGKTDTLQVGDETPTGSGSYVKLASGARVFTIASTSKAAFDKVTNDLRDKRLLTFDSEKLSRIEVAAKGTVIEFGKSGQNDWQIVKPRPLRADGSQIEDLIRKLKDAKLDPAMSDEDVKKAEAAFKSGVKVATVTATDASGSQSLEIRKDKDKNYYAKSSVVAGVHKSTAELGDGLDKSLDDFRNKKLFDFGFNDPNKVEINGVAYSKSGEKWSTGGKQMDAGTIQNLIDKLRDLAATKFPEKGAGDQILAIAVTPGDGKHVEKLTITKQASQYFARRENEPSIYELDAKAVEALQKAAAEVKEFKPAPAQGKK